MWSVRVRILAGGSLCCKRDVIMLFILHVIRDIVSLIADGLEWLSEFVFSIQIGRWNLIQFIHLCQASPATDVADVVIMYRCRQGNWNFFRMLWWKRRDGIPNLLNIFLKWNCISFKANALFWSYSKAKQPVKYTITAQKVVETIQWMVIVRRYCGILILLILYGNIEGSNIAIR